MTTTNRHRRPVTTSAKCPSCGGPLEGDESHAKCAACDKWFAKSCQAQWIEVR